jgi:dTDP-4-amino-4,6-dideoxy-D-galactose acyltransferase
MITYLAWDSDFFERKIGRISLSSAAILEDDLADGKAQGYDLIYVFSENEIDKKYQDKLVDIKVIFEKGLENDLTRSVNSLVCGTQNESIFAFCVPQTEEFDSEEFENLYHLAYISGEYSRFKKDKKIGEDSFQKLYREWVNNSINQQIADYVLVYEKDKKNFGMVTLKLNTDTSVIGLIAVDNAAQGMGIGQQLMAECERISIENNIKTIEVATQELNQKAYQFYQKCGFLVKSRQYVYHFWL